MLTDTQHTHGRHAHKHSHTRTRVYTCPFTWQPPSLPKSLGMASATLGCWGLCLRAGDLLVFSASSPRLPEKGSSITQDKRPGDGSGTQNITVNTTLSQKHPRAAPATGRKSPRTPPRAQLCQMSQKKSIPPPARSSPRARVGIAPPSRGSPPRDAPQMAGSRRDPMVPLAAVAPRKTQRTPAVPGKLGWCSTASSILCCSATAPPARG